MDTILNIAKRHDVRVVEDNAQAIGAEYKGRRTGGIGDVGCLSFFPSKNLGAYGDGGMVVTNDEQLAKHVKKLRTHGWSQKYYPEILGYNSRLDELLVQRQLYPGLVQIGLPHDVAARDAMTLR